MRLTGVATVLLLAFAVPVGAAPAVGLDNPHESTPTTLYAHIEGIQDFPINTQEPEGDLREHQYGLATLTGSCLVSHPAVGLATSNWHTYYGYATPGFVEYHNEEDGRPRIHIERGISFDVELDPQEPFTTFWYLETQAVATGVAPDVNTLPMVVPEVVVRATLRSGDEIMVDDAGFNKGEIIAQGQTAPATLSPLTTDGHPEVGHHEVDGRHVYGFAVPMEYHMDRIDGEEAFNLRIDVFMENPLCDDPTYDDGDRALMPNHVRLHSSPDLRPRMELATLNPLRTSYFGADVDEDRVGFHLVVNSPWGNYDVDPDAVLVIEGPDHRSEADLVHVEQRAQEYGHHGDDVELRFVWDRSDAPEGLYAATLHVGNLQGTANATAVAAFHTSGQVYPAEHEGLQEIDLGAKATPLAPLGLLLVGLAALVLRRRS